MHTGVLQWRAYFFKNNSDLNIIVNLMGWNSKLVVSKVEDFIVHMSPPVYMYIMYMELLYMSFYALLGIKKLYVNGFTMHLVVMWGFTEVFYICTHYISNVIFIVFFFIPR